MLDGSLEPTLFKRDSSPEAQLVSDSPSDDWCSACYVLRTKSLSADVVMAYSEVFCDYIC